MVMQKLVYNIKELSEKISNNIIFIPALFGIGGFVLGMVMRELESMGISSYLIEKFPFLVINNYDTATTLLSYQSSGIISIMVFSFSMVMVLLNQAASKFSPRVLPGLISVKKHQYILGLYLLSFFYNTFTMIDIKPTSDKYQLPGFSVLLGIAITTACLFAFVYFINSISQAIQLNNILDKISHETINKIDELAKADPNEHAPLEIEGDWFKIFNHKTGYFRKLKEELLLDFCKKNEVKVFIKPLEGTFLIPGTTAILCNKKLDKDLQEELANCLEINRAGEDVKENYLLGFKQITEIATRALSPGVNDPGSAISAIDYLTEMFAHRIQRDDERYIYDDNKIPWAKISIATFEETLYQVMIPFRTYGKTDLSVSQRLVVMLQQLYEHPHTNKTYKQIIKNEIENLKHDVLTQLKNERDIAYFESLCNNL